MKNVRIYDNGGRTFDQFTVVYMNSPAHWQHDGIFQCLGMSEHPTHPQGFGQHGTATPGRHLGKMIKFEQLPVDCQNLVLYDLDKVTT